MGLTNMAEASNTICDPEDGEDTLLSWLKRASLEKYQTTFAENGITEIAHLEDVKEEDAIPLGLTKFEARRLARVYTDWKTTQEEKSRCGSETAKVGAKATYKTSTSSVVLSLPPVMKNFVETRDGMGNVVVSTASLKSKFSNLWYESPVCPRQTISNSFILQMASERFKYSKSLRDCELWCRKERSKRIPLLFGIVKGATLDNWSPHFKKQSVLGQIEIMKKRHPEIVSFKENERLPGKKHYDQLCKFVEGCQDALSLASKNIDICREEIETTMKNTKNGKVIREGLKEQNNFYTELMPKLQSVLEDAKEFLHPYEAMVDQCREKLGSSTAEKLCKRKRSKNKLKEARRKRQKAATCTETINVDEEEINPKRDSKEGGQQEDEDEWTDCDTV